MTAADQSPFLGQQPPFSARWPLHPALVTSGPAARAAACGHPQRSISIVIIKPALSEVNCMNGPWHELTAVPGTVPETQQPADSLQILIPRGCSCGAPISDWRALHLCWILRESARVPFLHKGILARTLTGIRDDISLSLLAMWAVLLSTVQARCLTEGS